MEVENRVSHDGCSMEVEIVAGSLIVQSVRTFAEAASPEVLPQCGSGKPAQLLICTRFALIVESMWMDN